MHRSPTVQICAGTAGYLDAYVEGLANFLGVEAPRRIDYYYQPTGVEDECYAVKPLKGCAFVSEGVVWAERPEYTHELVHATLDWNDRPAPFLQEGMAVLFSDDSYGPLEQKIDNLAELFQPDTPASELYHPASGILNYLLHDFGPEQLMQFYRATPERATLEEADASAADSFGLSLEEVSERAAELKLPEPSFAACLATTFEEFDEAENGWQQEISATCADNAIGPHGIVGETAIYYSGLTLPSSAFYQFTVSGDFNRFVVAHCDSGKGLSYAPQYTLADAYSGLSVLMFSELEAGNHVISTKGPPDREFSATIEARRVAPLLQACEADVDPAAVVSVDSAVGALALSKREHSLALPFSPTSDRVAVALGSQAQLCDRDCVCEGLAPGDVGQPIEGGQRYWMLSHDAALDQVTRIAFE